MKTLLLSIAVLSSPAFAEKKTPRLKPVAPPAESSIKASMGKGVVYLLKTQNKNGSWGSATRTKDLNIYAPIPGAHHAFRAAVTSLVLMALIETEAEFPQSTKAINKAEKWMLENLAKVKRATPVAIYNVWAHSYAISALVRMHKRTKDAEKKKKIVKLIKLQFNLMDRYESVDGGWGYYDFRYGTKKPSSDSISFTTATALVAFHEAKSIGIEPPKKLVKRGVASILRQRKKDFSYLYGEYLKYQPARGINRPGGSLGRSQACNVALRLWGDKKVTDKVMSTWLHRLFARNGWLDIGRKRPIPHESWFQVAGYFYYYGHFYGAMCIHQLPKKARPEFQAHMAHLMLRRQEKDGSWFDYPFYNYHQPYGTAFVILTLQRCLPEKSESTP